MNTAFKKRDYRLTGPENQAAQDRGLASAEWYSSPISRKKMKELMRRTDGPAIRDTAFWFALLAGTGIVAYWAWGTWWAVPAFFLYATFYASPADSRWHECGHGTAFKTPWMNEALYQIASFMALRPATPWRWSHTRHHTDTYIIGRDPEIATPRPPVWRVLLSEYARLTSGPNDIKKMIMHTFGVIEKEEKEYIPLSEYRKTFWEARVYMLILVAVIAACFYFGSILPALFIVLPTFYGYALALSFGLTQHIGLNEDVLDHRLNTRTVYMNPFFRFLYWNMNYHIEHHMFPMVPYHALPALHEEIKHDCPPASPNIWAANKEVFLAIHRQQTDPTYTIERHLPSTAAPYKYFVDMEEDKDTPTAINS